jgi:DNA-binding transcriptional ArsR family regulator
MARPEQRKVVDDVRALAALAHPVRVALLLHLMAVGDRTASECAAAADTSPSNASWHLRQLAKAGFVERAPAAADGRERPWRATATGLDFSGIGPEPAGRAALQALAAVELAENDRLARAHLRHEDELPAQWRDAAALSTYGLLATPDELRALVATLDAAIRPYLAPTRADAPPDARPVHVFLTAFRRPDAR